MPEAHRRYIAGWRRLMPDWQVMAWTDADLDWSVRYVQEAYATRGWNRLSNYLRAWALHHHGGFYLDTDVELVRPLDPLLGEEAVLGFQCTEPGPSMVNGAVFGARPGHPFTARLLRAYQQEMPGWRRMGDGHGPGLITRLLRGAGLGPYSGAPQRVAGVTVGPVPWFYPYDWRESFTPECIRPETFAVHHWYGTVCAFRPLTPREQARAAFAVLAPGLAAARMRRHLARQAAPPLLPPPSAAEAAADSGPIAGSPA
jgi:hypothetical protein